MTQWCVPGSASVFSGLMFFFLQTSDVDIMEIAWGVDIDPVIAMISIAFG